MDTALQTAAAVLLVAAVLAVAARAAGHAGSTAPSPTQSDWRVERRGLPPRRRRPPDRAAVDRLRRSPSSPSAPSASSRLFALILVQGVLPWSLGRSMHWDTALNTAVSFVTNTNWQSYAGEAGAGHTVQMLGPDRPELRLGRGRARRRGRRGPRPRPREHRPDRQLLGRPRPGHRSGSCCRSRPSRPCSSSSAGSSRTSRHRTPSRRSRGSQQVVQGGPVASQEAIKELGTNGGGFFNANSAHPFENPGPWTNLLEVVLLLLVPFSLPHAYGLMVGDRRQGARRRRRHGHPAPRLGRPHDVGRGVRRRRATRGDGGQGAALRRRLVGHSSPRRRPAPPPAPSTRMHDSYSPLGGGVAAAQHDARRGVAGRRGDRPVRLPRRRRPRRVHRRADGGPHPRAARQDDRPRRGHERRPRTP